MTSVIPFKSLDPQTQNVLVEVFEQKWVVAEKTKGLLTKTEKARANKILEEFHEYMKKNNIAMVIHCPRGYQMLSEESYEKFELTRDFLMNSLAEFYKQIGVPLPAHFAADFIMARHAGELAKRQTRTLRVVRKEDVAPQNENMALQSEILKLAKEQLQKLNLRPK